MGLRPSAKWNELSPRLAAPGYSSIRIGLSVLFTTSTGRRIVVPGLRWSTMYCRDRGSFHSDAVT